MTVERITGAALQLKDGRIVCSSHIGGQHHSDLLFDTPGITREQRLSCEQGFVTSKGRFVDRKEARLIAIAARQIEAHNTLHYQELFTEDLW